MSAKVFGKWCGAYCWGHLITPFACMKYREKTHYKAVDVAIKRYGAIDLGEGIVNINDKPIDNSMLTTRNF